MAYENYGIAGVPGSNGTVTWTGLDTYTKPLITSLELTHDYGLKQDLINPATGEVIGNASGRETYTCRISALATSLAEAGSHTVANAALSLTGPNARAKVTIASSKITEANGDWIYDGGFTASETADGFATISMNLVRYTATGSDSTTLTTAAS